MMMALLFVKYFAALRVLSHTSQSHMVLIEALGGKIKALLTFLESEIFLVCTSSLVKPQRGEKQNEN